jgi:hypothetical protein
MGRRGMQRGPAPLQVEPSARGLGPLPVAWRVNDAHNLLSMMPGRITTKLNRKVTPDAIATSGKTSNDSPAKRPSARQ